MPHRVNDEKGKMTRDTLNINFKSCLIDDRCDTKSRQIGHANVLMQTYLLCSRC